MEIKVNKGDTLSQIAQDLRRQGISVTWQELARANNISDPRKMRSGIMLKVPGAEATPSSPAPSSQAQAPSPLAQKIQAGLNAEKPTALGALTGDINFSNWANQQSIQPSFDAMQQYGMNVLGGIGGAALPGAIARAPKFNPGVFGQAASTKPGTVSMPMARGAVPHAGAKPSASNVRPLPPGQGEAIAHSQSVQNAQAAQAFKDLVQQQYPPFYHQMLLRGTGGHSNALARSVQRGANAYAGQSRPTPDISQVAQRNPDMLINDLYAAIYGAGRSPLK